MTLATAARTRFGLAIAAIFALAAAIVAAPATPAIDDAGNIAGTQVEVLGAAAAAGPVVNICNSSASVDWIAARNYSVNWGPNYIRQGECWDVPNDGGNARVDVDVGGHGPDVQSWRKAKSGEPYGTCYNNEEESSNPYDGTRTTYRNFIDTGCHN